MNQEYVTQQLIQGGLCNSHMFVCLCFMFVSDFLCSTTTHWLDSFLCLSPVLAMWVLIICSSDMWPIYTGCSLFVSLFSTFIYVVVMSDQPLQVVHTLSLEKIFLPGSFPILCLCNQLCQIWFCICLHQNIVVGFRLSRGTQ